MPGGAQHGARGRKGNSDEEARMAEEERRVGRALVGDQPAGERGRGPRGRDEQRQDFARARLDAFDGRPLGRTARGRRGLVRPALAGRSRGRLEETNGRGGEGFRLAPALDGSRDAAAAARRGTSRAAGTSLRARLGGAGGGGAAERQHPHDRREGDQEDVRRPRTSCHGLHARKMGVLRGSRCILPPSHPLNKFDRKCRRP